MSDVNDVANSIADAVLDLRFTSKDDIKSIVITHLKHLKKSDDVEYLKTKITEYKSNISLQEKEKNFWKRNLRIIIGEENMKSHYKSIDRIRKEF